MVKPKPSVPPLPETSSVLDPQACYAALCAKDASQDGLFYVGVSSTGIYCRPVCRVRTPKQENCHFFSTALAAQAAGYRACLRCRPEQAPQAAAWSVQDVSHSLAQTAAQLLDPAKAQASDVLDIASVATRLGISTRHLHRVMLQTYGLSPKAYQQQARIRLAKQLMSETHLTLEQLALRCGYTHVRAFHRAFFRLEGRSLDSLYPPSAAQTVLQVPNRAIRHSRFRGNDREEDGEES